MEGERVAAFVQDVHVQKTAGRMNDLAAAYDKSKPEMLSLAGFREWRIESDLSRPSFLLASEAEAIRVMELEQKRLSNLAHPEITNVVEGVVGAIRIQEDPILSDLQDKRALSTIARMGPGKFLDGEERTVMAEKIGQIYERLARVDNAAQLSQALGIDPSRFTKIAGAEMEWPVWLSDAETKKIEILLTDDSLADVAADALALTLDQRVESEKQIAVVSMPSVEEVNNSVRQALDQLFMDQPKRLAAWWETIRERVAAGELSEEVLRKLTLGPTV